MDEYLALISQHLEFLGYSIEPRTDESFRALHEIKPSIAVRRMTGGCLITAWYGTQPEALVNREGFLEAINSLNALAIVSRYYVDKEFDFTAETFYVLPYERAAFAQFMELWDRDFMRVLDSDIEQYLS